MIGNGLGESSTGRIMNDPPFFGPVVKAIWGTTLVDEQHYGVKKEKT